MKKKASAKQPYVRPQAGTFRVAPGCPFLTASSTPVTPGVDIEPPTADDDDTEITGDTVIEDEDSSE